MFMEGWSLTWDFFQFLLNRWGFRRVFTLSSWRPWVYLGTTTNVQSVKPLDADMGLYKINFTFRRWRILWQQSTSWSTFCWKATVLTSVQASHHAASSSLWEPPLSQSFWIQSSWQTWWVYLIMSSNTLGQEVAETQTPLPAVFVRLVILFNSFLDVKQLIL